MDDSQKKFPPIPENRPIWKESGHNPVRVLSELPGEILEAAALNGVPHLSILDRWWVEGYNGKNGWAFGEKEIAGDRDPQDAQAIYELLEKQIIPLFYQLSDNGLP